MAGLQNFIATMKKSGGFARLAKYEIELNAPAALQGTGVDLQQRDIQLLCDTVIMPGHDLQTQSVQHGNDIAREQVTAHAYEGTITASFYLDDHFEVKSYFDLWQQLAVNPRTNKANYYNNYVGSMKIFQLGEGKALHRGSVLDRDTPRKYGIEAIDVYPVTIGQIEYGAATVDEVAILTVEFQYRKWRTINPNLLG